MEKSKIVNPKSEGPLNLFMGTILRMPSGHAARTQIQNPKLIDRLTDDGITEWHPAFLSLGKSLEECAARYRGFCKKYKPKPKPEKSYHWGSKLLPKVAKGKGKKKTSPGQMHLWDTWEVADSEVSEVAEKFVMANCYDPKIAMQFFNDA